MKYGIIIVTQLVCNPYFYNEDQRSGYTTIIFCPILSCTYSLTYDSTELLHPLYVVRNATKDTNNFRTNIIWKTYSVNYWRIRYSIYLYFAQKCDQNSNPSRLVIYWKGSFIKIWMLVVDQLNLEAHKYFAG